MNKTVSIIFIVILSILTIILSSILIFFLDGKHNMNWSWINTSYSEKLLERKEFDNADEIDLETNVSDVYVEKNENEKIIIEFYSDYSQDYTITKEENTIKAKLMSNKKAAFMKKGDKVIIHLPQEYDKKMNINQQAGDIKVDSFENLALSIKLTTGDLKIKQTKSLNVESKTGDVDVESAKQIKGSVTTGDLTIENVDEIDMKLTTGDIKIDNLNKKIKVDQSIGDIRINKATIEENSKIALKTGDIRIKSIKGAYIEASNRVGETKISDNDRHAEYILAIKSDIGDIMINYE